MNYKHFIGIDVSKNWLDLTVLDGSQTHLYKRIENSLPAVKTFFKELKSKLKYKSESMLVCMEHTGIYNHHLLSYLGDQRLNVCLESGLQIKQSSGLKRGKNDKVDSLRIAMYAYKNRYEVRLWQPKRAVLESLKHRIALRNRLTNALKQLKTPLKEAVKFIGRKDRNKSVSSCKSSIKALTQDLKALNKEIQQLIKSDPELDRLFNLVSSVTGIGPVTATEIILATNEFKTITCHKKFACYGGVAPFEHQSGSSIRGKTRVSSMGNKQIKKLLHMAALSAASCPGDLKNYFLRKVEEGKNKMLIINAIRNKLIARVFACVKQNRPYQKFFQKALVYP